MRHRVRIQPYVSPDLRRRLAAYSAAQDVTESAVAEAALTKYLEPDRENEALMGRRLDSVVQTLGRVEERLEVVAEAVGRFVRFSFQLAPERISAEAMDRGAGLYRAFLAKVATALAARTTFVAAVRRARLTPPAAPVPAQAGGREGKS